MAAITPRFMFDFETRLNAAYSNAWSRKLKDLWWDRITARRESTSKRERFEWLLETAQIYQSNSKGSEMMFEDLASIVYEIENVDWETALELNRNEIEDNAYDKAGQWSRDAGSAAAYHPQKQIVQLLKNGKSQKGYDGQNFFSTTHPVNPYDSTLGNYSNLFTNKDLNATSLAAVMADIAKIKMPSGDPRGLRPSVLIVDPSNAVAAYTITQAEIISDPTGGTGTATNMVKRAFPFAMPIIADELADEPGVWYLAVEADEDALGGGLIYQERKPFEITSYVGASQAELDRMNMFEWHLRGRNVATYGHPYMIFRIEPPAE